jgi:16S rRNA (cytosine1402-N4)-methyltransferase
MDEELGKLGITVIDGVAFDLGFSSMQIEESGRGFSFLKDEPLSMALQSDPKHVAFTAEDIVNGWDESDIANVIFGYGEERYARRIAQALVEARETQKITTTGQLVEIIKDAVPGRYKTGAIHPATRTFQALRIAVNDELNALKEGLQKAYDLLAPSKRMAVVSFHSLEDRIVKEFSKEKEADGATRITKKPIVPTSDEVRTNPRSRSAKLRILEK